MGQFTLYDLVLLLLVANALQPAITGPDNSLLGGFILIASLLVMNAIIGRLVRFKFFDRALNYQPTIFIEDGKFLEGPMRSEGIDQTEAEAAIREHGIAEVSEVKLGVLEPDGNISIIGYDSNRGRRPPRRRRLMRRGR